MNPWLRAWAVAVCMLPALRPASAGSIAPVEPAKFDPSQCAALTEPSAPSAGLTLLNEATDWTAAPLKFIVTPTVFEPAEPIHCDWDFEADSRASIEELNNETFSLLSIESESSEIVPLAIGFSALSANQPAAMDRSNYHLIPPPPALWSGTLLLALVPLLTRLRWRIRFFAR